MKPISRFRPILWNPSNRTLTKWILSGCIILLIPTLCILVDFLYAKQIILREINGSSRVMLGSIQHSVDTQLTSLLKSTQYILINPSFSNYELNTLSQGEFSTHIRECQKILRNYQEANSTLDILVYFPNLRYAVTPDTANEIPYVYDTIMVRPHIPQQVSLEKWEGMLSQPSVNQFSFSPWYSYTNFGDESIVLSFKSPKSYAPENSFTLFVSAPSAFMTDLVRDMPGSTFCILNRDGRILQQFGARLPANHVSEKPEAAIARKSNFLTVGGAAYACSYTKSAVTDWYYAVYTPNSFFLQKATQLRNISLISIMLSLLLGIASIAILQIRNYRPLKRLIRSVPVSLSDPPNDEFELLEKYYKSLHEENHQMSLAIQSRSGYAKEIFLLSKLKGRDFYLSDTDVSELLEVEQEKKQFAIASIYLNATDDERLSMDRFNLLVFAVTNVMRDIFVGYHFEKTVDEFFIVFLFSFSEDADTPDLWEKEGRERFQQIYEFFRDNFNIELSITMGKVFNDFEEINPNYAAILDAFEYRYVIKQYGVLSIRSLGVINFTPIERLKAYKQKFAICAGKRDFETAAALARQMFDEFSSSENTFRIAKYHLFGILSELLLTVRAGTDIFASSPRLDPLLRQLAAETSPDAACDEFVRILKFLYGEMEPRAVIPPATEELIAKIKKYVGNHYMDCTMSIASIAEAIGLTPQYMSRLFKTATSEGLLAYINRMRIDHAKQLLLETNDTIDEIGTRVGFSNSRSFRRDFLKIVGMNPTNFRH